MPAPTLQAMFVAGRQARSCLCHTARIISSLCPPRPQGATLLGIPRGREWASMQSRTLQQSFAVLPPAAALMPPTCGRSLMLWPRR
jgi:hypothetical protein